MALLSKTSRKQGSIEYLFESFDHPDSPYITSIHAGCRGFTDGMDVSTYRAEASESP